MSPKPICAIVDAYSSGALLVRDLLLRGFDLVHIQSSSELPQELLQDLRKSDFVEIIKHGGHIPETLKQLKTFDPQFVVTGHEVGVELADQLSEALNLRSNGTRLSQARRNKYAMVERLKACRLPTVDHVKSTKVSEILAWVHSHSEFPVVLKPLKSSGTDKVFICRNETDVQDAFSNILGSVNRLGLKNTEVLAQSFLDGPEYFIDSVSLDGEHLVTDICKYVKVSANGRDGIYESAHLLPFEGQIQSAIATYFRKVLDALEIRHGSAHGEVILTSDGPILVEVGARCPGGGWPDIVDTCTGYGQIQGMLDTFLQPQAFRQRLGKPLTIKKHAILVFLISQETGSLATLPTLPVEQLPTFHSVHWNYVPGQRLNRTIDAFTSPGFIALVHDNKDLLEEDHEKIRMIEKDGLYAKALSR